MKKRKYLRKRAKLTPIKSLQRKAEKLWKEACGLLWDNSYCHVKRNCPEIAIKHSPIIQIDHVITRANKMFFLDIKNGVPICKNCNLDKSMDNKSVHRAVDFIAKSRDIAWFTQAVQKDQSKSAFPYFGQRWWLEDKIKELERHIDGVSRA